jgi:hypothetical protein
LADTFASIGARAAEQGAAADRAAILVLRDMPPKQAARLLTYVVRRRRRSWRRKRSTFCGSSSKWGGGCLWPANDAAYLDLDLGPYDPVSLLDLGGSFDMIRNARLP